MVDDIAPGHPHPLALAVTVRDPGTGERRFARIKVPPVLPRLWEVGTRTYILLEQIIAANLDILFVIDNSASMAGRQKGLMASIPSFLRKLDTAPTNVDYRIGMTTGADDGPWG